MSEKRSAEKLAGYRVDRGKGGFKAIPMTEREVEDRNFFIRLKLRGSHEQAVRQADRAGAGIPDGRSLDFRG